MFDDLAFMTAFQHAQTGSSVVIYCDSYDRNIFFRTERLSDQYFNVHVSSRRSCPDLYEKMMNTDFLINRANELIASFQIKNEWSLSISGGLPTEELFEGFIVSKHEVVKYGSVLTDIRLHVAGERTLQFSMHVHTTWTLQEIAEQIALKEIAQLYHFEKATKYGAEYIDTGLEQIEDPTIQFYRLHMPEVVLVFT